MAITTPMPESPSGDWRVSLVAAKGVKGPIDIVELQLEGKTNTFDVTPPTDGGAEVVRRSLGRDGGQKGVVTTRMVLELPLFWCAACFASGGE